MGSKAPTFNLTYTQAIKNIINSDVAYSKLLFHVRDNINLKLLGSFVYRLDLGGFLNKDSVAIPDYVHYQGNMSSLLSNTYINAFQLFERGNELAKKQGLILADTKYEFGKRGNAIVLMDEIHTPDSSRYFYAKGFDERQQRGEKQKQLSKEFVREWLIANEFMGQHGQTVPKMTEDWVYTISKRYIELYEAVTGKNLCRSN